MAVVNQRSSLPMLGRVAGLAAPLGPFEVLLNTGFVRWDPSQPAPLVEFAHPLYRQAVYEDLSPTRRWDLHRAVARVLTPAAVLALRVAAADGVDDGLADELERMRQRLPQPAEQVSDHEANMLVTRGVLGMYAGRTGTAISDRRAALRTARITVHQIARCHFQLATLLVISGDWDEALVQARTAASIASDHQQVWVEPQCQAVLGTVLAYRGDWEARGPPHHHRRNACRQAREHRSRHHRQDRSGRGAHR